MKVFFFLSQLLLKGFAEPRDEEQWKTSWPTFAGWMLHFQRPWVVYGVITVQLYKTLLWLPCKQRGQRILFMRNGILAGDSSRNPQSLTYGRMDNVLPAEMKVQAVCRKRTWRRSGERKGWHFIGVVLEPEEKILAVMIYRHWPLWNEEYHGVGKITTSSGSGRGIQPHYRHGRENSYGTTFRVSKRSKIDPKKETGRWFYPLELTELDAERNQDKTR